MKLRTGFLLGYPFCMALNLCIGLELVEGEQPPGQSHFVVMVMNAIVANQAGLPYCLSFQTMLETRLVTMWATTGTSRLPVATAPTAKIKPMIVAQMT